MTIKRKYKNKAQVKTPVKTEVEKLPTVQTLVEYFDITNPFHVMSMQWFNEKGAFPPKFLLPFVNYHPKDTLIVNKQLVEAGVSLTLPQVTSVVIDPVDILKEH